LHVFNEAWRRLYSTDALSRKQKELVERAVSTSSRLLRKTTYPATVPARVPFMANKGYWLGKLWRDRDRSMGRKVLDVWQNGLWTVRSQLHLVTQKPFLVTLSGCDGSGKTVQARALEEAFGTCDMRVAVVWSRGASSRAAGVLIRLAKRLFGGARAPAQSEGTEADKLPRRRAHLSHPAARTLFSLVYAAELFWTYIVKTRWLLLRGHAVVCDRYVADAVVDFAVLSGRPVEDAPLALRWLARLAPTPHLAFMLDVIEAEALARKPEEGRVEHLTEARRAFLQLAPRMDMMVIPAHVTRAQAYETIVHETLSRFYLRYRTVINWLCLSNPRQINPRAWRPGRVYPLEGE
jgi:thymidylate kinase